MLWPRRVTRPPWPGEFAAAAGVTLALAVVVVAVAAVVAAVAAAKMSRQCLDPERLAGSDFWQGHMCPLHLRQLPTRLPESVAGLLLEAASLGSSPGSSAP